MKHIVLSLLVFGGILAVFPALGQNVKTLSINAPRPVAEAVAQIEAMGAIPINYEDPQYNAAPDMTGVATWNPGFTQVAQSTVKIPTGGKLTVSIPLDPGNEERLGSVSSVQTAVQSLIEAANGASLPARFSVVVSNGAVFVMPTQWKSASGEMGSVTLALSSVVNLDGSSMAAFETLTSILQQVSATTGSQLQVGSVPFRAFAETRVSLRAVNEPAYSVLARLFDVICSTGVPSARAKAAMAYTLLHGPGTSEYVLNVHLVAGSLPAPDQGAVSRAPTPGGTPAAWFDKK